MAPAEVSVGSLRRTMLVNNPQLNNRMLLSNIDDAEELRDSALLRIQNYQQAAARHYNTKVKPRSFTVGDLVLCKVYENTAELNAGKLGAKWEGPYLVSRVVRSGVYELLTMRSDRRDDTPAVHQLRHDERINFVFPLLGLVLKLFKRTRRYRDFILIG